MKKVVKLTESDLMRIVKRVINEEDGNSKDYETLFKYVVNQFKGMKRDRWGWNIGEKNVLQYVNNHFIVNEDLRDEIKEVFGINDNEVHQLYKTYLKKRFPNEWQTKMYVYNEQYMKPPLQHGEITSSIESVGKKEYRYKCKLEPIVSFCNSKVCSKREFGVGDDVPPPEITGISKYPSDPPLYFVNIDGDSVEVDDVTLHDPEKFSVACMNQISKPMLPVGKIIWRKQLVKLFEKLQVLDAPDSAKVDVQIKDLLADFINKAPGKKLTDVMRGLPFTEEGISYFKFLDFWKYLQRSKSWVLQ